MKPRRLFILASVLLAVACLRAAFVAWVDATELPPLAVEQSVEMRDRNGSLLRAYTVEGGRWRLATGVSDVDPQFVKLLLAYEDKRFFSHHGVDWQALARAAVQDMQGGRVISGGSTLTMQVARLLENSGTGRWGGKLRQIRVALALERRLSKERILSLYLNLAPYGGNLEGLRAASLAWFGKEPGRLTPAQAALLIALPQSPEQRRPDLHHDKALAARNRVLERLMAAGVLGAPAAEAARTQAVPARRRPFPALAPHLTDRLRAAHPLQTRFRLTLDGSLQRRLEKLAAQAVSGLDPHLSVAFLVADHKSGEILASVGSAGYRAGRRAGFVDMTQALRSPGSTLKPLIYAMAFDQGIAHPETLIEDSLTAFGPYVPLNFDGRFQGTIRLRRALQMSLNIPAVKLADALGPARIVARLRRAGARPVVPGGKPGLAIALGGLGITLHDLVQLYASLAEGGQVRPLRVLPTKAPALKTGSRLVSPQAAWQIGDILSGLNPPPGAPRNHLAYKTGTSYGNRDTWAIGYDGRHVAGVWLGRADGTAVPGAMGAKLAAPVLFDVFARLKPSLSPLPPPPPGTLLAVNAPLPAPLRHFRPKRTVDAPPADAPKVAFPPDGAVLEADGALVAKVRDGIAPFTWLLDGVPAVLGSYERQAQFNVKPPGFVTLSVIDAKGRSARTTITLQ